MMGARDRTYVVSGVCCATEEAVLRKRFDAAFGGERYSFSLASCELRVEGGIGEEAVIKELRHAGFDGRGKHDTATEPFRVRHAGALQAGAAGFLTLAGILLDRNGAPPLIAHGVLVAAVLTGGARVFLKAVRAAASRVLDMNVLMTIAVLGALLIGKWEEGAAVIVLFSLSLMLESYSAVRTRRAVHSLVALSPSLASVLRGGGEQQVSAVDVAPGETVVIRPGERIPLDGIVTEGTSSIDEAAITGESTPVPKVPGEKVFAGTMNERGALKVRVTSRFEDTRLARIVHLIEEAQHRRAPIQNAVDRFAAIYTPAVMVAAVAVALVPPVIFHQPFGAWVYRSLVLLVIACPCALVISTPVAIVSALTNAARRGMLIKGGKHIETLGALKAIAFDKTGTLTEGRPKVTDIIPLNSMSADELLRLAAAIEHGSEHHLASAVLAEAARRAIRYSDVPVERFEAIPGLGVKVTAGGTTYYLGNHRLCKERGYCSPWVEHEVRRLADAGKTAVILGSEQMPLGIIAVKDNARGRAGHALEKLKALGIRHMVLLSGDHEAAAGEIAAEVGLQHARAALLPAQKVAAIEELVRRFGSVAMVGDGINDAPALAASSVGIAMGVSGTDTALETADVVLMSDDLSKLPHLIRLGRKTSTIVRQNIAIALSLKLVFLLLALGGIATLWMAVLADDGAALVVIFNALRLLQFSQEG